MIFVGYELGSKRYQFWDTAHHQFKISHDMIYDETLFPAKEATNNWTSMNDLPISTSDKESDKSGLELVIPTQSSPRPPSPGQSATHPLPPIAPLVAGPSSQHSIPSEQPAHSGPPEPQYSL